MARALRIAVAFDPHEPYLRHALRGVADFAAQAGGWELLVPYQLVGWPQLTEGVPLDMRGADGYLTSEAVIRFKQVRTSGPVVVLGQMRHPPGPTIAADYRQAGRMVAEAFIARGFRSLAFFGGWAHRQPMNLSHRLEGFHDRARQAGLSVVAYPWPPWTPRTKLPATWKLLENLGHWLLGLPRPCGLLAATPACGPACLAVCKQVALAVPDDISICCGGDDEVLLTSNRPRLSAVRFDGYRLGYRAAEALARLLRGRPAANEWIEPLGIVHRQTTQQRAATDPVVRSALAVMTTHVGDQLTVEDLLDHLRVSRSTLQRRFSEELGTTPAREIQVARVNKARQCLLIQRMTLAQAAQESGYPCQSAMSRAFKAATGLTPLEYRRHFGLT